MIIPKEYKGKQGVYLIRQPDGKYYIGSSVELYNRLRVHKTYFDYNSRDYQRVKYTCRWNELDIEILQETTNLTSKELKSIEQTYIDKYWSEYILNSEKRSEGRTISKDKNPNWKGGVSVATKKCKCGSTIKLYSNNCYSCTAKNRHIANKVDKNKRFI